MKILDPTKKTFKVVLNAYDKNISIKNKTNWQSRLSLVGIQN